MSKFDRKRLEVSVNLAQIKDGENILDVGSGRSMWMLQLISKKVNYHAVDIAFGQNLENGLGEDIMKGEFDVIFLSAILEHVENFKTLLKQCKEILSENGRIIINTPSNLRIVRKENPEHIHCFSPLNVRNLSESLGLKIEEQVGDFVRVPILDLLIPSNSRFSNSIHYRLVPNGDVRK